MSDDHGDQIIMVRDEGTNDWRISAVLGNARYSGHVAANFVVNDGTGLVSINEGSVSGEISGEEITGRAIRTLELIVQAYNGTHVGRTA